MLVAFCLAPFLFFGALEDKGKEERAANDARVLTQAVKFYYAKNGQWPKKLTDVAQYLETGKKALADPWGKEYQFSVTREKTPDGTTVERPCIWTERVVGTETKVYGTKPKES